MGVNGILRVESPEEKELNKKKAILEKLTKKLLDYELELATLTVELNAFERVYLSRVGKYLILQDQLLEKIKKILSQDKSGEKETNNYKKDQKSDNEKYSEYSGFYQNNSDQTFYNFEEGEDNESLKSNVSKDLKQLFREIAKKVHPDFAANEEDRVRREELMKEANVAFTNGDIDRLRIIYNDMLPSIENESDQSIASQLVIIIRKIDNILSRISVIKEELMNIKSQDLFCLMMTVKSANEKGVDLLEIMRKKIENETQIIRVRLKEIILEFSNEEFGK